MSAPDTPDLATLKRALEMSWGPDTCDPFDLDFRSPENPSRGQCIVTSLVVQDYLGGELLEAIVLVNGVHEGYHTWGRIDGEEVDLTIDQFEPHEVVGEPYVVPRISGPDMRMEKQYEILRARVSAALGQLRP